MKILSFTFVLAIVATLMARAAAAEKSAAPAEAPKKIIPTDLPVPKSNFTVPAKPQDGHDPFFPTSDRLFAVKTSRPVSSSNSSAIVWNGISGSQGRRFAMINGHTFAEGEEAMVSTATGRVRVLLVSLNGETAIVEVAGERRELTFQAH